MSDLDGSAKVFSIPLDPCCCWGSCWDISAHSPAEGQVDGREAELKLSLPPGCKPGSICQLFRVADEYSSSKSYVDPVQSISLPSRDLVFLVMGEQPGARHSSAQCPEYMGLAATGVHTVLLLEILRKNAVFISFHFTVLLFMRPICVKFGMMFIHLKPNQA